MDKNNLYFKQGETEEQYIYRVCSSKEKNGMLWQDVADILNKELNHNYTESAYRKKYQQFQTMLNANRDKFSDSDKQLAEIRQATIELEKEKTKLRRERNEYSRLIREQADRELFMEQIKEMVVDHCSVGLEYDNTRNEYCDFENNDLLISFSDVHTGIEINNIFNEFDQNVLKDRINKYLDKIIKIQKLHKSRNAHVIMSELISGYIHPTLRLENNMDVISQFLLISDYLSEFFIELSYHFENVYGYMAIGNHSRTTADKKQNLVHENFDFLAIPYLKNKLIYFDNIRFIDNDIEQTIAMFNACGNIVMASHGDRDDASSVVQKWTLMFGKKPDIVMLFHRHTNSLKTVYDTKVIQSGCFSGTDEYALNNRLKNKPEQIVAVVTNNGLECMYDVTLN